MKRLVFALDLVEDCEAIAEYEAWHQADRVWPTVLESLRACGLENVEIFRTGNRLCLIMDAPESFCLEAKAAADAANPEVQAWEHLMWRFQRALPWAAPGEKWVPMRRMFSLAHPSAASTSAGAGEAARSEPHTLGIDGAESLAFRGATPSTAPADAAREARKPK